MKEINIITITDNDGVEWVAAFTSREQAIRYFTLLNDKGMGVSIHSVEIDSGKDLIMQFDL